MSIYRTEPKTPQPAELDQVEELRVSKRGEPRQIRDQFEDLLTMPDRSERQLLDDKRMLTDFIGFETGSQFRVRCVEMVDPN